MSNKEFKESNPAKLLGVEICSQIDFDVDRLKVCLRAAFQLNVISILKQYTEKEEKTILVNEFMY